MSYKRKTRDVYDIQGDYGYGHGWETVTAEETYRDARVQLRGYRDNEPGVPFRIKITRERIPAMYAHCMQQGKSDPAQATNETTPDNDNRNPGK
jgi:hypothetical protein